MYEEKGEINQQKMRRKVAGIKVVYCKVEGGVGIRGEMNMIVRDGDMMILNGKQNH